MTKTETVQILAAIEAFYPNEKMDRHAQIEVWHIILQQYDYNTAMQAVLNYAKNDRREYGSFPTAGNIIKEIEQVQATMLKPVNEILLSLQYGTPYKDLSTIGKVLIDEPRYEAYKKMNAELLIQSLPAIKKSLLAKQGLLEG